MRQYLNRFLVFGVFSVILLLTSYSDTRGQSISPPCPPCYEDRGGYCIPKDNDQQINQDNGDSIFGSSGFGSFFGGISSFFSGAGNDKFNAKTPNCGGSGVANVASATFPAEVNSAGSFPKQKFPSGRDIQPDPAWAPRPGSNGRYNLTEQASPEGLKPEKTITGQIGDYAYKDRNQWRGSCGRGIFLYETLRMHNANSEQKKAVGAGSTDGCTDNDYNSYNNNENCRVDVKDIEKGTNVFNWNHAGPVKQYVPRIYTNDIWYSRTGCFNPEERFVHVPSYPSPSYFFGLSDNSKFNQYDFFEPIFNTPESSVQDVAKSILGLRDAVYPGPLDEPKHYRYSMTSGLSKLWRPVKGDLTIDGQTVQADYYTKFVPNDRILMRHPYCLQISSSTPGIDSIHLLYNIENKNADRDDKSTNELIERGKLPVCLGLGSSITEPGLGDIIDETDNFCAEFLNSPSANKVNRFYLSGNCWEQKSIVLAPGPYDHWMPQAVRTQMRTYPKFSDNGGATDSYGYRKGTYKYTRLSQFWRAITMENGRYISDFKRENPRYVVREYLNNLNLPTYTPHSLKNAYNSPFRPDVGNPYAPGENGAILTNELPKSYEGSCISTNGVSKNGSSYNVNRSNCEIATNIMTQGEYGYRDHVIDRGPFLYRWLRDSTSTNPADHLVTNPYVGEFWFTFDQAAQFLRNNPSVSRIEGSTQLNYLPGKIIPIDYAFNPYNIYSPMGPEYEIDQVNKPQFYGRKYKLQQCLRLFVEKWAFEGDKGNIVLNKNFFSRRSSTADFTPDISYCQWSAYYAASEGDNTYVRRYEDAGGPSGMISTLTNQLYSKVSDAISEVSGNVGSDIEPFPTKNSAGVDIKRPMNSEFFDYLNFISMGAVETAGESGCQTLNCFVASNINLGSLFENSGLDQNKIVQAAGMTPQKVSAWQSGQVDLAQRDCSSIVPPNYMRDNIRPFEQCNGLKYGWWRIKNPIKSLFCFSGGCMNDDVDPTQVGSVMSGGKDDGGALSGLGNALKGISDLTDGASLLTTEVDKPVLSLITPIIQGLPTVGMGMKFPDGGDENAQNSSSSEGASWPDFSTGSSRNDGMPKTGTIDLKVIYFQYSMPPLKIILRDNWLSRMGGIRVVPYNILGAMSGNSSGKTEVEANESVTEEVAVWRAATYHDFWDCNPFTGRCNEKNCCAGNSDRACQANLNNDRNRTAGFWESTHASCNSGCCVQDSSQKITIAKSGNFAGLPIIQFKDVNGVSLPAGKDWIDHSLPARSCQHTILSALLQGFQEKLSLELTEAWSEKDDISLLGVIDAITNLPAIATSVKSAASQKNFQPVIEALRIYGGFRVFQYDSSVGGDDNAFSNNPITNDKLFQPAGNFKIFYSWFPSPWVFKHGAARNYWCEFQLPYIPYFHGQEEWKFVKSPVLSHGNINSMSTTTSIPNIYKEGPFTTEKMVDGYRPQLTYYRPERIRDGCGAFAIRATWVEDKSDELSNFLIGRNEGGGVIHKNRCSKWEGLFGNKYDDPKLVSWRLPRFDYEFLKSFLECTGPIRTVPPINCVHNDYAAKKNTNQGIAWAASLVGHVGSCIFGTWCEKIPNDVLKMVDYFTRGDTWYGIAMFADYNFSSDSAVDDFRNQQNSNLSDTKNDLHNDLTEEDPNNYYYQNEDDPNENNRIYRRRNLNVSGSSDEAMDAIKNEINDNIDATGDTGDVDFESICREKLRTVTDGNGNDVTNTAVDKCVTRAREFKAKTDRQIQQARNNGQIKTTPSNQSKEEVGDLSCYERNAKNLNGECFHGGTLDVINDRNFGDSSDQARNRPCQDCSMQISNFWRIKSYKVTTVTKKRLIGSDRKYRTYKADQTYGTNEPFGFWCTCPQDDTSTTRCREDLCTCDQHVMFVGRSLDVGGDGKEQLQKQMFKLQKEKAKYSPGTPEYEKIEKRQQSLSQLISGGAGNNSSGIFSPWAMCKDYGPMRRWLQCYYQARAKACPILTREISDTEPPANLMNNMRFTDGIAFYKKTPNLNNSQDPAQENTTDSDKTGVVPVQASQEKDAAMLAKEGLLSCGRKNATGLNLLANKYARWMAEEPNHLARLPVKYESAGASFKHQDLVFQSQTRDIEAPFMEMSVPFPIDLLSRGYSSDEKVEKTKLNQRGTDPNDTSSLTKDVYLVIGPRGNEIEEIESRGDSYKIDIGQLLAPKFANGKLNPKYWDLAVKFENGLAAANAGYNYRFAPEEYPDSPQSKAKQVPGGADVAHDHKFVNPRAQDAIVGPRGCDIGGWYEMMLYQARCIKFFGLNCICDYDKTFARGDAKAHVLSRAGMEMDALYPVLTGVKVGMQNISRVEQQADRDVSPAGRQKSKGVARSDSETATVMGKEVERPIYENAKNRAAYEEAKNTATGIAIRKITKSFPLMDRGIIGPEFALGVASGYNTGPANRPQFRLWDKGATYTTGAKAKGLDYAMVGDILIYDETIEYNDGTFKADAGYPRHVAYVEKVNREPDCRGGASKVLGICPTGNNPNAGRPMAITVSEMNWGKNLDSCGVTDTWGITTRRTLLRPEELDTKMNERRQNYASCQNPDWALCEEKYWDKVHLYRPYTVKTSGSSPTGFTVTPDPAYPVCTTTIPQRKMLTIDEIKTRSGITSTNLEDSDIATLGPLPYKPKEVIEDYDTGGNKWMTYISNYDGYDLRDVTEYIKEISATMGTCDPDPARRSNFEAVKKDYISAKDYLDVLP